jgi:hypothetical protein
LNRLLPLLSLLLQPVAILIELADTFSLAFFLRRFPRISLLSALLFTLQSLRLFLQLILFLLQHFQLLFLPLLHLLFLP